MPLVPFPVQCNFLRPPVGVCLCFGALVAALGPLPTSSRTSARRVLRLVLWRNRDTLDLALRRLTTLHLWALVFHLAVWRSAWVAAQALDDAVAIVLCVCWPPESDHVTTN